MIKVVKIIEKKLGNLFDFSQIIAHWGLRPRRAKTKLIVKIYMKKVEI
jgi:hypothetical protein